MESHVNRRYRKCQMDVCMHLVTMTNQFNISSALLNEWNTLFIHSHLQMLYKSFQGQFVSIWLFVGKWAFDWAVLFLFLRLDAILCAEIKQGSFYLWNVLNNVWKVTPTQIKPILSGKALVKSTKCSLSAWSKLRCRINLKYQ